VLRHQREKRSKFVVRNHCSIHNISRRTVHHWLDVLRRRKGRTLQAACPKHEMQLTARDCFLNHVRSGQRILREMKQQVLQLWSLLHFYQRHQLICCSYSLIHYKGQGKWGLQNGTSVFCTKKMLQQKLQPTKSVFGSS